MHHLPVHPISRRPRTAALLAVSALAAGTFVAGSAAAGGHSSYHGVFTETAVGAGLGYDLHGAAKMTVGPAGTTVKITVAGLDSGKDYGSHLHNGTCASGGGSHYQDLERGVATPPNELWLTTSGSILESNRGGVAHGRGSARWQARTSGEMTLARSVVVHEPGGARIACADLG